MKIGNTLISMRFLLIAIAGLFCAFSPCTVEGVSNAGRVEVKGLFSIEEREFLDMFGIREGTPLTEEAVGEGIRKAFLKGIFDNIAVTIPDGELPVVVTVKVREREVIGALLLSGDYEISSKEIKKLFLMKEGNTMRYDLLDAAVERLKQEIALYGFPAATIEVKTLKAEKPYRVNLLLNVNTGRPLKAERIKISLPLSFSHDRRLTEQEIISHMNMAPGDIFDRKKVDSGMKAVKEFLKTRGYYKPVVGPYSFLNSVMDLSVDPGKRLEVSIEGNRVLSDKLLRNEVPFFESETFNDEAVEEAMARMLALYHREGYPFVQIAPVIESKAEEIAVSFFIVEGEKIKVQSVSFLGTTLPNEKLREVISLKEGGPFNPDLIGKDKEMLREFYGALGYMDATVKELREKIDSATNSAEIFVDVEEGKKTVIGSFDISGVDPETRNSLIALAGIKTGDPYNEVDISDARFRILEYFNEHGYPAVDVALEREVTASSALITFKVVEGNKKVFGRTIISGNTGTRYTVIRRELQYKEGQPYSYRSLAEERQRLYKLRLFTDVEIETIDTGEKSRDVLIRVHEGEAGSVEFGVGYAEVERYRGFVEVGYRNLWGLNREGLLRAELSSIEQRYIVQYNEPWFLGQRLPLRTFFLYENRMELNAASRETLYHLKRATVTSGVEKKLSDTMKTDLYYEFSLVRTFDVLPDVVLSREDTGTLAISSIKPSLVYDTRDNPFDPKRGVLAGLTMKVATAALLSETNFAKLEVYASKFQRLSRKVTLAISGRAGVAYGMGQTHELPIVERFFLGGRANVRGYAQDSLGPKGADGNPTGGNAFLMGSFELRMDAGRGIGIVPFFDMGNVWIHTSEMRPSALKYTSGIGLRYSTPVGPLRIDYGMKLNREPGESRGDIHFSIGHAF